MGPLRASGLNRDQPLGEVDSLGMGLSHERMHPSAPSSIPHAHPVRDTHTRNRPSLWGTFYGLGAPGALYTTPHLILTTDLPSVLSHLHGGIQKGRALTYLPT